MHRPLRPPQPPLPPPPPFDMAVFLQKTDDFTSHGLLPLPEDRSDTDVLGILTVLLRPEQVILITKNTFFT